jgi:hypothetical protein
MCPVANRRHSAFNQAKYSSIQGFALKVASRIGGRMNKLLAQLTIEGFKRLPAMESGDHRPIPRNKGR